MLTYTMPVTESDIRQFRSGHIACPVTVAIERWANRKLQTEVAVHPSGHVELSVGDDTMTFVLSRESRRFHKLCRLYHQTRKLNRAEDWDKWHINPTWLTIEF